MIIKFFTLVFFALTSSAFAADYKATTGDIVFHTSSSSQSKAIQLATHSPYSHMGVVIYKGKHPFVFEAVQPVKYTPLQSWLDRGEGGHYVIKRLKAGISDENIKKIKSHASAFEGKNYDSAFDWSDDKIYCSELVYKIYDLSLGIKLATLSKLKDFDLSSEVVKKKLEERYGSNIPLDAPVISPSDLFESDLLEIVNSKLN